MFRSSSGCIVWCQASAQPFDIAFVASANQLQSMVPQGDEFAAGLTDGVLLKGDKLNFLRLAACNISDEGACKLAKTLEAVGGLNQHNNATSGPLRLRSSCQ